MSYARVTGQDEIYIGGEALALYHLKKGVLEKASISHIVSVLNYNFKRYQHLELYKHLVIEADDVEDQNLLEYFEKSGAWIEDALKKGWDGRSGIVLVHCAMGISRSVTIVLAYLLRQNKSLEVNDALSLVRQSRPEAHPNNGFMAQLKLYKEMGCPHDIEAHPKYQSWIYQKQLRIARDIGLPPTKIRFFDEEQDNENRPEKERELELRCRRCR